MVLGSFYKIFFFAIMNFLIYFVFKQTSASREENFSRNKIIYTFTFIFSLFNDLRTVLCQLFGVKQEKIYNLSVESMLDIYNFWQCWLVINLNLVTLNRIQFTRFYSRHNNQKAIGVMYIIQRKYSMYYIQHPVNQINWCFYVGVGKNII